MSMLSEVKLYNQTIELEPKRGLSNRISEAIKSEVADMRWSIGDRLPSLSELEEITGLGRYPLQSAIQILEDEGILEKVRQSGTFLKRIPEFKNKDSLITILVSESHVLNQPSIKSVGAVHSFDYWSLSHLQRFLSDNGYGSQIQMVNERFGSAVKQFDKSTSGIISFVEERILKSIGLIEILNTIPIIYLGVADRFSIPSVTGDIYTASFLSTQELVRKGHRDIAFYLPCIHPKVERHEAVQGHIDAMEKYRCEVNYDAIDIASKQNGLDLLELRKFVDQFSSATALITADRDSTQKMVEMCDLMEIDIPDEFSICSLSTTHISRKLGDLHIAGAYYDWDSIMIHCIDTLESLKNSKMVVKMSFIPKFQPGNSIYQR